MCELLIRIEDRARGVPGSSVAGDVIAVMPDGHPWSAAELDHPQWQIVRLPGLPEAPMLRYMIPGSGPHKRAAGFAQNDVLGAILRAAPGPVTFGAAAAAEMMRRTVVRA